LFHELPRRKDYPDYYKAIPSPICLDMIKSNIESDKYDDWSFLFEDFELLVNNAKEYNMPGSEVYEDADTIDKFCKSYPFYQKPNPKPNKKGSFEDNTSELAKQQQNSRVSKRGKHY
ncbi:Bromodomain-containing protein, partial [Conidiobolus coronatus NRRL 28638]